MFSGDDAISELPKNTIVHSMPLSHQFLHSRTPSNIRAVDRNWPNSISFSFRATDVNGCPLHSLPLVLIGMAFEALRLRYNGCALPWHLVWEQSNNRSRYILCLLEDSLLRFIALPYLRKIGGSVPSCRERERVEMGGE